MKQLNTFLEARFKLSENKTNLNMEILGGITTFATIAYILAVIPSILSETGMDKTSLFVATALASGIGTIVMGIFSNYPFALAPGIGAAAFFTYSVVLGMGLSWQLALTAVFVEGIIFTLLSLTNVREAVFNCIPNSLKIGVSTGIGLFVTFIGLQSAKIVVPNDNTIVAFYNFSTSNFYSQGITVLLALLGILITGVLMVKKQKGAILVGIVLTWGLGILCELFGIYIPNPELGAFSLIPNVSQIQFQIPSISSSFAQFETDQILSLNFVIVVLTFLFVDVFDTLAALIGVAMQAKMLDKNGQLPRVKQSLLSDSFATTFGALLGVSTTTAFVESSAGVSAGARTGLASVVTGILFLLSLVLAPFFLAIPTFATAPALILVGLMMLESILNLDFENYEESIPAFIATIAMPFSYTISEGVSLGVISYMVIKVAVGKAKEVNFLIYILSFIFVLKYIFI